MWVRWGDADDAVVMQGGDAVGGDVDDPGDVTAGGCDSRRCGGSDADDREACGW